MLLIFVFLLVPHYGVLGAAVAFLISTISVFPLLRNVISLRLPIFLILMQFIIFSLAFFLPIPFSPIKAIFSIIVTSLALHVTRLLRISEMMEVVKLALTVIFS